MCCHQSRPPLRSGLPATLFACYGSAWPNLGDHSHCGHIVQCLSAPSGPTSLQESWFNPSCSVWNLITKGYAIREILGSAMSAPFVRDCTQSPFALTLSPGSGTKSEEDVVHGPLFEKGPSP